MTYDASNRKDIRAAEKAADLLSAQLREFLTITMSTPLGRRWFYHFLSACQCFVDTPTFEPNRDYFSSGRRSIGLHYMAEILTHCPDQYNLMLSEEHARLAAATERSRRQDARRDDYRPELDPADGDPDPDHDPTGDLFSGALDP